MHYIFHHKKHYEVVFMYKNSKLFIAFLLIKIQSCFIFFAHFVTWRNGQFTPVVWSADCMVRSRCRFTFCPEPKEYDRLIPNERAVM